MTRPAPKPLAQLAVAVFVIALLAWGWSYLPATFHAESRGGTLYLVYSDGHIPEFDSDAPQFQGFDAMVGMMAGQTPSDRQWRGLGFTVLAGEWPRYVPDSGGGAVVLPFVAVLVPWWSVVALSGVLVLAAVWRVRRVRKLERHGHCTSCGYDLRFSRDRCPECGSVVPEREQEAAA